MRNKIITALIGLPVLCVVFIALWSLLKPRHLLPLATGTCLNAEITETDSLLAVGYNRTLYEFKGPAYSDPSVLYTAQSRLISVGSLRNSPIKIVVGDRDGWLYFPGTHVDPIQVSGGMVLACAIISEKGSSRATIVAAGHDGIQDYGWGGNVCILSYQNKAVEIRKNYKFEWTPNNLCIARKSKALIVGCERNEFVHISLNTDQRQTIRVKGGTDQCVLSHDESLLAIVEYQSVSVRRVSHLEKVIARIEVSGNYSRICWHPTEPDVLIIAEPEAGIKLLNVSNNGVQFVENTDFVRPVLIWMPKEQKSAYILDRDWSLVNIQL
ncbi:hypothetical protein [Gimesia panareensis]|nr:hypothetical protein [Gimesia panareensis]